MIQLQAINYILDSQDKSFLIEDGVSSDYFSEYQNEYNYIKNHFDQYGSIPDKETFLTVFPNFNIVKVNEPKNYILDELHKDWKINFQVNFTNKLRDLIMSGKNDEVDQFIMNVADKLTGVQRMKATNILEDTSRYDNYVEKCTDFNKYFVSTGFRELDVSLGGGIDRQNAYFVISARAGVGKTLVMVKFASAAVEKGLRVGMYEGEMTTDKIGGRYDSIVSHISNSAINQGKTYIANDYKNFLDNLKNKQGEFFVLTPNDVPKGVVTVDILEQFIKKYNLDILLVDQISLLDDKYHSKQFFEQASNISKGLKRLQVKYKIPIVVASQQNRTGLNEGKMAGTENLSLSDRIGQDATVVLFIKREDEIMTFNIAKSRDGCIQNELKYETNFDKCEFTYMPLEDDKLIQAQFDASSAFSSYDPSFQGDSPIDEVF